MRPSWDDYFISIAYLVSTRATCDRKKVGAVIVDNKIIIATGYNGSAMGMPHCDEAGHELKEIEGRPSCVRTLHAESNALDFAGLPMARGAVLYSTVIPCYDCAKRIVNAGIEKVFYAEYYASRNTELVEGYFETSNTKLYRWNGEFVVPSHVPEDILKRTAMIQGRKDS